MERSKFNFAAVFSLIVLLVYSYITFLGLVYWRNGDILLPLGLTLGFMVIIVVCLLIMCAAKATRWHRIGMIGQVLCGLIIFATFIASAIPFTNFMRVVEKQDTIAQEISNTLDAARNIDKSYIDFANKRINYYKERLEFVSNGKSIRPSEYNECMGRASGESDKEKIENLAKSLKMKLLPDTITVVQNHRQEWLQSASNMSVWNVMLPANIVKINKEVNEWTENYIKLSSVVYMGEESEVNKEPEVNNRPLSSVDDMNEESKFFTYEEFNNNLSTLISFYTELHKPTFMALVLALLGFTIMLLPYITTESSLAGATSGVTSKKSNNSYE